MSGESGFTDMERAIIKYGFFRQQRRMEEAEESFRKIQAALRSLPSATREIPQLGIKDPRPCVHAIGATTCGYQQEHRIHEGSIAPAPPAGRHVYTPPADG